MLPKDAAEQEVVAFMLSVFQVLGEDIDHRSIERHDQRHSVLCDVDVYHIIIKILLNSSVGSIQDTCYSFPQRSVLFLLPF